MCRNQSSSRSGKHRVHPQNEPPAAPRRAACCITPLPLPRPKHAPLPTPTLAPRAHALHQPCSAPGPFTACAPISTLRQDPRKG
ncbi:hypothetical protein SLEP1_g46901 [Rubroshorea leprosula]|uniref:Uncharacterized protein n=1 Tax=Rubroshorea leprosula TaxID=152421 RepID=A0AAV5LNR6_9ROSI|nr:hypothetical protein SLEP1_g46901 [Rubroshorea leprosula]